MISNANGNLPLDRNEFPTKSPWMEEITEVCYNFNIAANLKILTAKSQLMSVVT